MSKATEKPQKKGIVKFEFPSELIAKHFVHWMCGQGEQDYWTWMDAREYEEPDKEITAACFKYAYKPDKDGVFECSAEVKPKED